ncbi:MAG: tyrosine-type recombinase/integrase [bacterium]
MDATSGPDLRGALPLFLLRCDAASTKVAYEREVARFLAWLDAPAVGCVERYVAHMRGLGLSPTTVRWRATVAAKYLRSAHDQGILPDDPTRGFRAPKGTSGFAPRILSAGDLRKLLRAPDRRSHRGKRDLAILVCLGVGGLRAGEVCVLSCGNVESTSHRVVLRVHGKGRKVRLVPLSGPAAEAIRAYRRDAVKTAADAPFFTSLRKRPMRLTVPSVDYILRRCCEAAALPRINAHALRHTAASLAIEGGMPLHRVRDLLGHSSVLVTSRYLHVTATDGPGTVSAMGVL